jgi:hypothetical protein
MTAAGRLPGGRPACTVASQQYGSRLAILIVLQRTFGYFFNHLLFFLTTFYFFNHHLFFQPPSDFC